MRPRRTATVVLLVGLFAACQSPTQGPRWLRLFPEAPHTRLGLERELRDCVVVNAGESVRQTVELPPSARLELHYGMYGRVFRRLRRPLHLSVRLLPREGEPLDVFSADLLPRDQGGGPIWYSGEADLPALHGPVEIEASVVAAEGNGLLLRGKNKSQVAPLCLGTPIVYSTEPQQLSPARVVVIGIDTFRADQLGAYGSQPSVSPTIDELARRGTLFERAYSQGNWTLPSFTSTFTSLYVTHHHAAETRQIPAGRATLPSLFEANGYFTIGFHGSGFLHPRFGWGELYDAYLQLYGFKEIDRVADYLLDHAGLPLFAFVHTYDTHAPYDSVPPEYREGLPRDGYEDVYNIAHTRPNDVAARNPLTAADFGYMNDLYRSEVRYVDDRLQHLIERLGGWKVLDDTLIVLLSDHGDEHGEHGGGGHGGPNLYGELTHVPLILAGPGIAAGRRVATQVELVDLLPTLAEQLGLDGLDVAELDGRSFAAVLAPDASPDRLDPRDVAISQRSDKAGFAVRAGRWELYNFEDGEKLIDYEDDPGARNDVLAEHPEAAEKLEAIYRARVGADEERGEEQPLPDDPELLRELRALGYLD